MEVRPLWVAREGLPGTAVFHGREPIPPASGQLRLKREIYRMGQNMLKKVGTGLLGAALIWLCACVGLSAQEIWTGPDLDFTKLPFVDVSLAENQDRITDNVWITRGNIEGIFNIQSEVSYSMNSSPADTQWAFGNTSALDTLTFDNWQTTVANNPPGSVGQEMVLHLISDDIFIDITFTSWGIGNGGGGSFSYTRSTPSALSSDSADFDTDLDIDGDDFLTWQNNAGLLSGAMLAQGDANSSGSVDTDDLTVWRNQYATTPALAASSVPEPSTAALAIFAAWGGWSWTTRRRG